MSTDHATFRAACAASEEHRGAVDVVAYPDKAFLPVAGAATEPQALTTPFRACPASELLAMGAMARSEFGDAARAALSESRDPWRADVPVSLTGGVVEFTSLSDEPAPEIPDLNAAVETIHMDIPGALLAGFAEVAGPYPVSLEVTRYLLVGFICGPLRLGWTPTRVALNGVLVERGRRG
jgi:hypothetical protein